MGETLDYADNENLVNLVHVVLSLDGFSTTRINSEKKRP